MPTATAITDIVTKATSREWIRLAVIALPCMLYSMDLKVLNLAVQQLKADLKPTVAASKPGKTFFTPQFVMVADCFVVSWMVITTATD